MTVGNASACLRRLTTSMPTRVTISEITVHFVRSDADTGQNRRPGALKGIARGS